MRKVLLSLGFLTALLTNSMAFADTFETLPGTSLNSVWDTTTGKLSKLGVNGKPNPAVSFPGSNILVGTTDTQTLTNKTLNGPVINNPLISGPAPNVCGATCTLTAANAEQTTLLNAATGSVATLPAATATGNIYNFVVSTTVSSNKDAVLTNTTDGIIGLAIGENAGTTKAFAGSASIHSLQMPFAGTQPSGGFLGDNFSCQDVAAATWQCTGTYQAGTTPTSPYSTATN